MSRSAGEIGAGLTSVRRARAIRPGERIHVVGIAGAGASAAALHAAWHGAAVSGCDSGGPSSYTPALEAAGIPIAWDHDPAHVSGLDRHDRLAVSKSITAVAPHQPELEAARAAGIPVEPWQQVVADAAFGKRVVAIAGTHGKSTTAGWLTHILVQAGRDPAAFVGALLPTSITGSLPATARQGSDDLFIVEADEYAGNFDPFRPDLAIVTNVDWDHPDVFEDEAAVVRAFARWLHRVPAATLAVNADDPGVTALLARLGQRPGRTVRSYVRGPGAELRPEVADVALASRGPADASGTATSFAIDDWSIVASIRLAGAHNTANALLAFVAARELGVERDAVQQGLASFPGVGRRLEHKGEVGGVAIYDDYGHHPTAIRATLDAVRQLEPGRRVWIAAEPLTFHRTAALLEPLAEALAEADGLAVADIWPNRDPDRTIASSAGLAAAVSRRVPDRVVAAPGDVTATADWLAARLEPGDVVLVMGGGHSYQIADRLLELLATR
ncbi:MAG TPA: Mur ligase family protein [Candidatus Limnocylindrales bacterium]